MDQRFETLFSAMSKVSW
jgi:hypothetical protein